MKPDASSQVKIQGEVLNWGKCICAICGKKGKLGTTTTPTAQNPVVKVLCLDCTLKDLSDRHGLSIKEAAKWHDLSQKSQEILLKTILERYKEETGKKPPKKMEELTPIVQTGLDWWLNSLTDKERQAIFTLPPEDQKEHFRKSPIMARPKEPVTHSGPQTGRNDPCPCGSGKKYKKCCLK